MKVFSLMIGILAFIFPIILFIQNGLKQSISICYYSPKSHDIFELVLGGIGLFFLCNRGYTKSESIANKVAGICMLLIALCACANSSKVYGITIFYIHDICAIILFSDLAYMSYFLFTKVKVRMTECKIIRNKIYKICGVMMMIFLISIILLSHFNYTIMISENLLFWTFAIAWLVQGELLPSISDKH